MLGREPNGKYIRSGLRCSYLRLTLRKAAALHEALSDQALPDIPPFLETLEQRSLNRLRMAFQKKWYKDQVGCHNAASALSRLQPYE